MSGFVTMRHQTLSATAEFADSPDVISWQEARGWVVVDPAAEPQAAQHVRKVDPGARWVNLSHPDLEGVARVANDDAVIADFWERGYRPAVVAEQDGSDNPPGPIGPGPVVMGGPLELAESALDESGPAEDPPVTGDEEPPAALPAEKPIEPAGESASHEKD